MDLRIVLILAVMVIISIYWVSKPAYPMDQPTYVHEGFESRRRDNDRPDRHNRSRTWSSQSDMIRENQRQQNYARRHWDYERRSQNWNYPRRYWWNTWPVWPTWSSWSNWNNWWDHPNYDPCETKALVQCQNAPNSRQCFDVLYNNCVSNNY